MCRGSNESPETSFAEDPRGTQAAARAHEVGVPAAAVVGADGGRVLAVQPGPAAVADIKLVDIVEILPVLLGVAAKEKDAVAVNLGKGAHLPLRKPKREIINFKYADCTFDRK